MDSATGWSTRDFRRQGGVVLEALSRFVEESVLGERKVATLEPVEALARSMDLDGLPSRGSIDGRFSVSAGSRWVGVPLGRLG